jgi:hypothetical protein
MAYLMWIVVLLAFSQSALCDVATDTRTPCSLAAGKGPETFSRDFCSVNCDSSGAVGQDLVQVFDYVHGEKLSTDYSKIAPTDLPPGQDSTAVANKVADNTLQYWWNNSGAKNSSLGQGVTTVEKSMQKDVNLGSGASDAKKQKLNFAVDAFQTQAKLKYEGYGNAEMIYQARDSSVALQMVEKVGRSQDLIFGVRSSDQSSQVTYKYNW